MNTRNEFELIPDFAKGLAAFVFAAVVIFFSWMFHDQHMVGLGTVMGVAGGAFLAFFVLLAGYVYADAARRAMPAGAWLALVLLIPNGVGFVLYFLLRKPMVHPCSACGYGVVSDAAYCARCGRPQAKAGEQPAWKEA